MKINIHQQISKWMFKEHMKIIKKMDMIFIIQNFLSKSSINQKKKKILITIDDGFKSFYTEAWPYLKENRFIYTICVYRTCGEKWVYGLERNKGN